jgi:uncharacterized membrane protein
MKWLCALFLLVAPAFAAAQSLPALYDVEGVAEEDVLNIRALPDASAPIIGGLAPDRTGVEITRLNERGTWGRVNAGDRAGWASMHYLARQPGQPAGRLPRPLLCTGTEPFWSLEIGADPSAIFEAPGQAPRRYRNLWAVTSANRTDRYAVMGDGSDDSRLSAMIGRTTCTDGMSDRAYGLDIGLLLRGGDGTDFLSGCCRLQR